ncbi:MAG: hypothetical protein H6964_17105 [Chromatiaceae bacterium]|nr:hypothetical protein [Gammaproteobacteria bacterium]MCB1905599.1 hypothetical protein [Gammaproteobacteria bacterium]MCP5428176.1 hypothetical protein [Chromatiaceae bacterium]MCP5448697.1 hypothetical protein [Chromatiaceae bacterium]
MNTFGINKIGTIATAILSIGVVSGCEYCQPLLLATIGAMAIGAFTRRAVTTSPDDLIEMFSHLAH